MNKRVAHSDSGATHLLEVQCLSSRSKESRQLFTHYSDKARSQTTLRGAIIFFAVGWSPWMNFVVGTSSVRSK